MEFSRKIKFGIIGCSRVAKKSMLPALNSSEIAEIEMIGSRSLERAKEFSKEFNCNSFGTYEDVLKNKNIDAVYISLPVGLHEEWAVKSAKAGKHILCEKSSTTSLDSAKRMIKTCKENNVRILECFMFKYHPQHKEVVNLIKEGILGDLLVFQGCFGFPFPKEDDIRLKKEFGGGVLNDAACYPIYASRMLFKEEPMSVFCKLKKDPQLEVDIKADIILNYPNGKVAFISSSFGAYFQSTYGLWGTKSYLNMKRAYAVPKNMQTSIFLNINDNVKEIIIKPEDHFKLMINSFCKEIFSKEKTSAFEQDLLSQAIVLEALRLSDKEERIVKISELIS